MIIGLGAGLCVIGEIDGKLATMLDNDRRAQHTQVAKQVNAASSAIADARPVWFARGIDSTGKERAARIVASTRDEAFYLATQQGLVQVDQITRQLDPA